MRSHEARHDSVRSRAPTAPRSVARERSEQREGRLVPELRALAERALARMYHPEERLFAFRLKRGETGIVTEGLSARYTAIVLIGLAGETEDFASSVLRGDGRDAVCQRLIEDVDRMDDLGDVALTYWAARALGHRGRRRALERLLALSPAEREDGTVELSWTLAALSQGGEGAMVAAIRERIARRLLLALGKGTEIFPHTLGHPTGLRAHVSCFADLVYPIHALVHYHRATGSREALDVAHEAATALCRRQGPAGQWWWHYDLRTGRVVERYPVYAVHQHAMGPMALFAVEESAGAGFTDAIARGLRWLASAPELVGGALLDERADIVWRKVARRGPRKLARLLQAAASRVHPALRVPGLGVALPPRAIDFECRPYELGWLLYAWPAGRARQWMEAGLP